jgi:predicted nicotinamide N-methyase
LADPTLRLRPPADPRRFISENLRLLPVPSLPEIRLYTAHPGSGLGRLVDPGGDGPPPYWAYPWAGGAALARFVLDRPDTVSGRRVLDLGSGSGLVAIAAARAGARQVLAAEIDGIGLAAIALNAAANHVAIATIGDDLTGGPPPRVDIVLAGDVFYDPDLALRMTAFLDRCLAAGIDVLVGDPRRAHLPLSRLRLLAEYPVSDFGEGKRVATGIGAVFVLERDRGAAGPALC